MRQDIVDKLTLAQQLATAAKSSPSLAAQYLPNIENLLLNVNPRIQQGEPTTRLVLPLTRPVITVTSTGVITPTGDVEISFPTTGWIQGIVAGVAEGATFNNSVSMKLRIQDIATMFTTGRTEGDIPLGLLSGTSAQHRAEVFPIRRRVDSTMRWFANFTWISSAFPATGTATYTPVLALLFSEDQLANQ